jgi:carboxypeptidase C (cathepsin A)
MRLTCLLFLCLAAATAQRPPRPEGPPPGTVPSPAAPATPGSATPPPAATGRTPPEEKVSTTRHTARIGGQEVKYTATAGTLNLKEEDGTVTASMFYIAYTKDDVTDRARRPLTFSFNGGPGSSSVWLHLGALGPRRVELQPDGHTAPPPYRLVDNEFSILDATDLVFIDPVSTGYSRAASEQEARGFHGFTGDLESMGEFIRLYTTRNARWESPKFLAGESYGTTRASALSGYLQQNLGMNLNGIMLISAVLNFGTISFDGGNDLPYVLFLPNYTATAWYHKKLPKDLQADRAKAIAEAERFAQGEYSLALMKGAALAGRERTQTVEKLARLTGLSAKFIDLSNLRVRGAAFTKELLRDERRTVGRYDSRVRGIDANMAAATPEYDPSYATVQGPFTAAWNQYVRAELKFESDLPYEILTGRVWPWNWAGYENRYVNVVDTLRDAMTKNPGLKVFVANGYYDLATPFFATAYTFDHLGLDATLKGNVSMGFYEAGHMMYTHQESLEKLKKDLGGFIAGAAK